MPFQDSPIQALGKSYSKLRPTQNQAIIFTYIVEQTPARDSDFSKIND